MQEMPNRAADQTEEEIAERCAEIRKGWTTEDFLRRRGILCPREYQGEWLPPIVKPPKFDSN